MKPIPIAACLCVAVASRSAQNYLLLPATANPTAELPDHEGFTAPFTSSNAHLQMFFDATEVGSTTFVADQLSLRYDGPIPQVGAPGPFTITRLQIRIGVTTVEWPGARFAENLTQPLQTVFDGPWTFLPDPGSVIPHPWGEPAGSLTFPFSSLAPIVIPSGGWLAVDLTIEGNNLPNFGFAHAILDGALASGGPMTGASTTFGVGCEASTGAAPATLSTSGNYAPGAAHFLNGQGLGANTIVIAAFGIDNTMSGGLPLPLTFPGTSCTLYVDPIVLGFTISDANGSVSGQADGMALAIPPDNAEFAGLVVYEQLVSIVPTANPLGFVFSNAAQVSMGQFAPPSRGTFAVTNPLSHTAEIATSVRPFGYAMRLRTL
jgi:hypothetical protein